MNFVSSVVLPEMCNISLKHVAYKLGNWGMATWHNKNMDSDAVDFAAVMSMRMAMHEEQFLSMSKKFKLTPWQQKWQHNGHNLTNLWPSQTTLS